MKPVLLKFSGINNFQTEQVIDFKTLLSGGLFGIFGETGSGKTTIIDAITLALYGKISRYDNSLRSDFININCSQASVYFEFSYYDNGVESLLALERKFQKKAVKSVDSEEIKYSVSTSNAVLFKINEDNNIEVIAEKKDINEIVENIIGLEYNDFLKTVILPQGKFSDFLNTKGVERSKMLERIFMLNEYGDILEKKIKSRRDESNSKLLKINAELKANEDITKEKFDQNKLQLNLQQKLLLELQEKNLSIDKEFNKFSILKQYYDDYLKNIKTRDNLLLMADSINQKNYALEQAKKALLIQPLYIQQTEAQLKYDQNKKEFSQISQRFEKEKENLILLKSEYENALKDKEDNLLPLQNKLTDLSQAIQINQEILSLKEKIKTYVIRYRQLENLIGSQLKLKSADLTNKKDKLEKQITGDTAFISIEIIKRGVLQKLFDIDAKIKAYNENNLIYDLANRLVDGESCPVCGSLEHPSPAKAIVDKIINSAQQERQNIIIEIENKYKDFNMDIDLGSQLSQIDVGIAISKERLANSKNLLDNILSDIEKLDLEMINKRNWLKEFRLQINRSSFSDIKALQLEKIEVDDIDTEINKVITEIKSIDNNINDKLEKLNQLCNSKIDLILEKQQTENKINYLIKTEKDLLLKLNDFSEKLKLVEIEKIQLEQNNFTFYNYLNERKEDTLKALTIQGFNNIEDFQSFFMDKDKIDLYEKTISEYNKNIIETNSNISSLEEKLKDIDKNKINEYYNDLSQKNISIKEEIKNTTLIIGGYEESIKTIENKLAYVNILKTDLTKETKQNDLLLQLDSLFKEKKFVKFIARKHLEAIITESAKWLDEMSRGKYLLELVNDEFIIIDNFNGGLKRTTTSLSGGETFMVSLSLALALASKVYTKNRSTLEFFFLDEGFGTLDNILLDTIMTCLEKLQSDGMAVGLISHVEELKNRIGKKIIIDKTYDRFGESIIHFEYN